MGIVIELNAIEKNLRQLRAGSRIVFTNGCFDILHVGHQRYLRQAKSLGDFLFVGLNSDESISRLKGKPRPINTFDDRAELLASLEVVDFVCQFTENTPLNLIKKVKPDILVKGGDWDVSKIVGAQFVLGYGGQVKSLNYYQGYSTTDILKKNQTDC